MVHVELDPADEWSESDVSEDISDSEVGDGLDWLDAVEGPDGSARPSAAFSTVGGAAVARRPNAHGGVLSRPFQPLSNRTQRLASHMRVTPLEAIDPRTRMVLFKMLNRGDFNNINGCISTGKEANVYHATKIDGQELAIKVYKTSVPVFKDRDRYVQGDYRFRYGYCKHNPRKMVKTWAEKEMRNLKRVRAAKI
ncbi:hypothetical protein VPH35_036598 [Triticum aestivum]